MEFYRPLVAEVAKLSIKYRVPPAAVLAIASVESGYGRGYVARITGNILSLGASKSEAQLPSLYLPMVKKTKKVIYLKRNIAKYDADELIYKQRPKSLKKDYRPIGIKGTTKHLDYFDNHPKSRQKANLECIKDFAKNWISMQNRYNPFKKARIMLDNNIKQFGINYLFTKQASIDFINMIGGKPNSFNYRPSWPKKVIQVLENTGLIEIFKKGRTKQEKVKTY